MSKVTILSKPNRIVIASKGVQGPPGPRGIQGIQGIQGEKGDTGDVTPEAIAARDAAVDAADAASQSADAAAASETTATAKADEAAASADLAEQARLLGATIGFATKAEMDASLAYPAGTLALVTNDATPENNGTYRKTGASGSGGWVQSADRVTGLEGRAALLERNMVPLVPQKNLLDKTRIRRGKQVSPGSAAIITSPDWRISHFIPVEAGKKYIASGLDSSMGGGWFSAESDAAYIAVASAVQSAPVTAPAGANFLVVNITNDGQDVTTYDETAQVEQSEVATAYAPYSPVVPVNMVQGLEDALANSLREDDFLMLYSFNRIDPAAVDYARRYSIASKTFTADTIGIAASARIPVVEGEWYTLSGSAAYSQNPADATTAQGGYFVGNATTAVQNIAFVAPVAGGGHAFQVPTGMGITHVVVNLWKAGHSASATSLDGEVQLELGEMATAYRPYNASLKVKPELLFDSGTSPLPPGNGFDAAAWYRFTEGDSGDYLADKLPEFRKHWLARDKNLCVVNTGTSLTARTVEHCTEHPQAAFRPPLMHSNNMASILWDKMKWDGQQYRRYDSSGFFTETGAFSTATNLAEWDDGAYRHGLTRYANGPASVEFTVPVAAWQFNFIYRTDSLGAEACTLTVDGGSGLMQVQSPAGAWVEANGYVFSMREPAPVARSIVVPNPSTGGSSTISIPSKGNTTYQKRLKMRCKGGAVDSRAVDKIVTVSAASGRFMYWGVEWSPREFMLTYVNAARGSHNTQATSATGLPRYQDNEVWSFSPDLLFFELPIHNDGAAGAGIYAAGIWGRLTENFVFREDYELSLRARAAHFGLAPEIGMFTSSIAWNFGGIDDDGSLKFGEQSGGQMMTALDKFSEAVQWVWEHHPDVVCIHAAKRWVDAGFAIFGDLRAATEGSGKAGPTFTNEGSHWNDTGSKVIAKVLTPVFEFIR